MTGEIRTVDVVIHGRVQGVGYRMWTRAEARRLGLAGHVRNRADGAVVATFAGPPEAVATMLDACRRGPQGARVTDVVVTQRDGSAMPPGFAILQD